MTHTVDLDDDMYEWLQGFAVPLEDTVSSVLRRVRATYEGHLDTSVRPTVLVDAQLASTSPAAQPTARSNQATLKRSFGAAGRRPKLDHRILRALGVDHFVVDGKTPAYRAMRSRVAELAHERAYLDARLDAGHITTPYFQRWKERGLPNPRGDAASRVILKVGAEDHSSVVVFNNGRQMIMEDFIKAFSDGQL